MSAILTVQNFTSDFVTTFWTPIFVGIFIAIVTYALWPRNQNAFDAASISHLLESATRMTRRAMRTRLRFVRAMSSDASTTSNDGSIACALTNA